MPFPIALVTSRFMYTTFHQRLGHCALENLGLEYVAAPLVAAGFPVDMYNHDFLKLTTEQLARHLNAGRYRLVGFYTNVGNALESLRLASLLRRDIHVSLGGYSATLHPDELIRHPRVDSLVQGEGEAAFLELAESLRDGRSIDRIPNVATKQRNNPLRPLCDVDKLPHPHRLDLFTVREHFLPNLRTALVSSSRGCLFNCSFCQVKSFYNPASGPATRLRDPIDVVDEVEHLVKGEHAINYVWFVDEDFVNRNPQRTETIAREIIKRKLKLQIECDCRSDSIDPDLFKLLKEAGLVSVFVGVESFSQSALDRMNKSVTLETNVRAIETLSALGIRYVMGIILFDAGTTVAELRQNVPFLRRFGYENLNDPCRFLLRRESPGEVAFEWPEDQEARAISQRIFQLSEDLCRQALRRGTDPREELARVRRRVGEALQTLVL